MVAGSIYFFDSYTDLFTTKFMKLLLKFLYFNPLKFLLSLTLPSRDG